MYEDLLDYTEVESYMPTDEGVRPVVKLVFSRERQEYMVVSRNYNGDIAFNRLGREYDEAWDMFRSRVNSLVTTLKAMNA